MKPKTQRMIFIFIGLALMLSSALFILNNFRDNLVFFYTPTELKDKNIAVQKTIRVGGLVVNGSIKKDNDTAIFLITDTNNSIAVSFKGILPPIFREGQGIVAQGQMNQNRVFIANTLLTKHDEKYMPPEVAETLKKSGNWHPEKFK